ncbi:hypothetical protein EV13_1879 [Prochlorococcus sp. MIT 0702]|nr:hypothetical protein EV13_1879 [Prochlorococcus sp. MIT 0702]KGG29638.1 hypothetical protein EV12_0048 [Prochlorococcus sp. MIT 0701]KGG34361.1 hypothetical protein EV14_1256 [Prochlorococcus sp. MIT 0703]
MRWSVYTPPGTTDGVLAGWTGYKKACAQSRLRQIQHIHG